MIYLIRTIESRESGSVEHRDNQHSGDVISIGERFGWVQALHARYVVVRDRDGVETLIPNENLITSEVINWSYSDRTIRVRIPVQISYDDDPEQVMAIKRLLES